MSTYSNWREDLIEVIDTPTTEKKAEKKIKETKVNNKVVINPTFKESVAAMGGEILEVAEVEDKTGTGEDPQIKSKEKRQGMIKRQVLLKKLQAVRAGGGADITAGYEPEGEMVEASAVLDANTKIQKKEQRKKDEKEYAKLMAIYNHQKDLKKRGLASSYEPEGELIEGKKKGLDGKECWDGYKLAGTKKKGGKTVDNCVKVEEGIMKMVKKVIRSQKPEKKAEKATDAGARARRKLQQKDHEKVNFLPMNEGKKKGLWDNIHAKRKRGEKPAKPGDKDYPKTLNVEGEDKAFNFVVNKLKKKYGDGVLTKGDKIKPLTPEQKKKNAEIMAKRAKQDGRDATEKASDGRYSDRYSNRGSD